MTSSDFLKIALGSGFIVLIIFICILISHLITTLRDVNRITSRVADITEKVHKAVIQPIRAVEFFSHKIKEFLDSRHEDDDEKDSKKK